MGIRDLSQEYNGWGMTLTTHFRLWSAEVKS